MGQIYFSKIYTQEVALERARETIQKVNDRVLDYVFVVPTEPLAQLARTAPRDGLIEPKTVAVANFALWRLHAFNQLVNELSSFLTRHADEITSDRTDDERRHELATAAGVISHYLHVDGIGLAWAAAPPGGDGWYRALVTAISTNLQHLHEMRQRTRWRWVREWPYVAVDALATLGVVAVLVASLASGVESDSAPDPDVPPATPDRSRSTWLLPTPSAPPIGSVGTTLYRPEVP